MCKRILIVSLFLFISQVSESQSNEDRAKAYFNQAKNSYDKEDYKATIKYLDKVREYLGKSTPVSLNLRFKSYYQLKDYESAQKSLSDFFENSKNASKTLMDEANDYLVKIDEAIEKESERKKEVFRNKQAEIMKKYKASDSELKKFTDYAKENVHLVVETSNNDLSKENKLYVEYKLYVSMDVSVTDFYMRKTPENIGFIDENIKLDGLSIMNGRYKGKPFRYVVLKKAYLRPKKIGKLTLDSMIMDLIVGVPTKKVDIFGNPIIQKVNLRLESNTKSIDVKK